MVVAQEASYPVLGLIWSMLIFFAWVVWIWLLIVVFTDMFRRKDIGGGKKTLWVVFTIFLPFIGVFSYLITQGRSMAERREQDVRTQRAAMDDYIRSVATTSNDGGDQLAKAKNLVDSGAITPQEYEAMKRKVSA